jgi:hypothetical protein
MTVVHHINCGSIQAGPEMKGVLSSELTGQYEADIFKMKRRS